MRQLNIKKEIIEETLDACGYFELPNGWVKYINGAKYNLERFHYVDGKLHLDGIKNKMHVVRWDKKDGSLEKRLMDREINNLFEASKKFKRKLREKN